MTYLSDDVLREVSDVYIAAGHNQTETARRMKIARSTLQSRLDIAIRRGFLPEVSVGGPVPPGFLIKGTSTLYGADGSVTAQWVKTREDVNYTLVSEAIEDAFAAHKGRAKLTPTPKTKINTDLLTTYPIADHHLGLFSWKPETGADYDLKIGAALLRDTMTTLVSQSPHSGTGLVLNLGDFFHSDNNENRTLRSGAALDVDTRYAKVLQIGVELMVQCIELALQRHDTVIVRNVPGNHDPYATLALTVALAAFFHNEPRVTVEKSPDPFFWFRFGKVFIGAAHGDNVKPENMPGLMAALRPQDWGASEFRYIYLGHIHKKSVGGGEHAGAVWETFQTLAAKDAWSHGMGYSSGRSMVAITHHKDKGEVLRSTVAITGR